MEAVIVMRARLRQAAWALLLSPQQLERVLQETQVVKYLAGSVVFREGEPTQQWVGVLDGMVTADTASAAGRGTTLTGVSSGGWLGEGSMLKRELRPYEVVALRDSWIALVPWETFNWLFETSLAFNHFLVHQLNARLGQFVAVVESRRIHTTTAQVAVCMAGLFNPTLCPVVSHDLRISHEEIAHLCGLSRQVVGRALHELEQAGLVRMQYGMMHVLDVEGLRAFGRSGEARRLQGEDPHRQARDDKSRAASNSARVST